MEDRVGLLDSHRHGFNLVFHCASTANVDPFAGLVEPPANGNADVSVDGSI